MKSILIFLLLIPVALNSSDILLNETFDNLDNWKELNFPKIENHSIYETDAGILNTSSDNSASGIILKRTFDVYEHPIVAWKWMIEKVYDKGDATLKKGDDYPIRVYIIFQYNPENAKFGKRIKYKAAKAIYGEYPPDSSLNYIWANREQAEIVTSPYTKQSKMWVLRDNSDSVGEWFSEAVNIIADYQKAFGKMPPQTASIAIMNDSDNTHENAKSYLDYIIIKAEE